MEADLSTERRSRSRKSSVRNISPWKYTVDYLEKAEDPGKTSPGIQRTFAPWGGSCRCWRVAPPTDAVKLRA